MGTSSSYVSDNFCAVNVVTMATFSLGYEGEEVPGEVKALEINTVMPQQVSPIYISVPHVKCAIIVCQVNTLCTFVYCSHISWSLCHIRAHHSVEFCKVEPSTCCVFDNAKIYITNNNQDTWLCVSCQESCMVHRCVIYRNC